MYNIALIGAGRIGQIHASNIVSHPDTNLYSIIDVSSELARSLAEKTNAKIQTIEEAMQDKNVHAVLIASSTDTHADLIELASNHGKTIFCEKPVHLSHERVISCLETVRKNKTKLFIGFNRRYDPHFRQTKNLIAEGTIGAIESLTIISRDPSPPPVEYIKVSGGLFRDMTIHDFDMVRFMMGKEPISIHAYGSSLVANEIAQAGDIDTAVITLKFEDGAIATIINSRRSGYGYDQRLEAHGAKGLLKVDNQLTHQVSHWQTETLATSPLQNFFLERYAQAYKNELNHFVDILKGEIEPETNGIDGERALFLADKAFESYRTNQEINLR